MGKTFLKRLAIAFSVGFALIYTTIYACGGGDWDWDWEWETNFTPETFVNEQYSPFFLSQSLFYDNYYLGDGRTRFDEDILKDWSEYLAGKIAGEDISFFLSQKGAADAVSLYQFTSRKKGSETVSKWAAKIDLKDKKVKNFFEFLYYGKQVEQFSMDEESWDYEEHVPKRIENLPLILAIEKKYNSTHDDFLKNRYWFQTVKAYFYSVKRADGVTFFEKTEKDQPKNTLYYRALSYVAGITGRMGNRGKSNYLYSQVFDKCPKLQTVAVFCFTPKEEKDWNDAFSYAKNTDEKVALWAIQGYYTDAERAIDNIYNLNPKSDYLEFLLARLVNQEEVKLAPRQEYRDYIEGEFSKTAVALIDKIAQSGKVSKPYLWNCAAGYMQTLDKNYNKADTYYEKAEKEMPKTELAFKQLRLLKFVNKLSKLDKITPKDETALVPDLNWLYSELASKEPYESKFRYQNAVDWSKTYLSNLYRSQNNLLMAEMFMHSNSFYSDNDQLLAMKTFLMRNDKTHFEQIAVNIYPIKLEQIRKYQAVMATFNNKINDAITLLGEDAGKNILLANPFNGNIKDCHDCDFAAYQKRKYSDMDFLKTIKVMKENLDKNMDVYTNAMLLGNAFYNITHYGNARTFHEGDIFGYGVCPMDFEKGHRDIVTDCSIAKRYYEKAFQAAQNDEQRAKMQYMLAKCERNQFYNAVFAVQDYCWSIDDDGVNFLEWNGFKNLKNNYYKTKFYQEALAECGYFRTYIGQNKK